jgi:hypothetical protein
MVVVISRAYVNTIELDASACHICKAEISEAKALGRKVVFNAHGTTAGCYCNHYFKCYREAEDLMLKENAYLFDSVNR